MGHLFSRRRRPHSQLEATAGALNESVSGRSARVSRTSSLSRDEATPNKISGYRMRALAFAAVGLLLNAYGATQGRREWVVKYDGTFYQAAASKLLKPGSRPDYNFFAEKYLIFSLVAVVTLSLGFGASNALLSGTTCLVLFLGIAFGRPLLCLPSLLLTVCELAGDVSDALVAAALLLAHLGTVPAALYSIVAVLVIAFELYLWHGVMMFYESGIMERIRCSVAGSPRSSATYPPPAPYSRSSSSQGSRQPSSRL